MICVYDYAQNSHDTLTAGGLTNLPASTIWIDLNHPSPGEEQALKQFLELDLPTADEMKDIESSTRRYIKNGATYRSAVGC